MGYLKITLQSDLCCASGEAFGSSIDSDVCMDEYGIPYLPAKRLKGCLRQRAEEILPVEIINEIFGTAKNEGCGVAIGNAYIEDYDVIVEAIKAEHVHKNMITQLFTSVRSQTKMEEGIADEGSLRSVRVMNEKSPITGESVVLIANVQLQKNQEDLKNVCKALRHIGLNRNRGLGVIRCTYDETSPDKPLERKQEFIKRLQQKKIAGIHYSVFFETPITLIGADGENEEYIEARAVIGCLAKEWLSKGKPVDDTFKRLFLSGDVIFSGLYPSYENRPCYPVPAFLQKAKETKLLFNSLIENHSPEKVTPKSIGGFAFQKENRYKIVKPKSDICYHNSITNKTLYMQESLGARQIYSGEIRMPQDCADIIVALLCNANLRFGRSKTAQYASCKLCFLEEKKDDYEENKIKLKEGDFLYVVLNENLLIYNDNGVNTINLQEVKEQIAKDLNMADAVDATYNDEDVCEYKMVGGYHTLWQLQKPMVKVIKGGSVYCFKIIKDREVPMHALVGENNKEGFGSIRLFSKEQLVKINLVEKASLQQ
ncbi:MAG: RAMP superfamily CRISPR-associated protein, partial [Anaerovorax sp.]